MLRSGIQQGVPECKRCASGGPECSSCFLHFHRPVPPITSTVPPAALIFLTARALNLCALTAREIFKSPSATILTPSTAFFTKPCRTSSSGVTVLPALKPESCPRLIAAYSRRKIELLNPRFGRRRCKGIWPPSKPRFCEVPAREPCPLLPRQAVLPCPEPGPRPTLLRLCVAPLAGFN